MRRAAVILTAALGLVVLPAATHAATEPTGGITLSPPVQQQVFSDGAPRPVTVTLTNNEAASVTLNLTVVDFKALNETGGVTFSGLTSSSAFGTYSLARYMSLNQPQISLAPGQSGVVQAELQPGTGIPVGGHYGAILVSQAGTGGGYHDQVSLRQVGAALVLAVKLGALDYNLHLQSIMNLPAHLLVVPASLRLRMYNGGNVQVTPRGTVAVTDPLGRAASKGVIDTESGVILPGSYRQYVVAMQPLMHAWLPGRYTITVAYRYDGTEQFTSYSRSVWVASWGVIGLASLIVAAVLAGLVTLYEWLRQRR